MTTPAKGETPAQRMQRLARTSKTAVGNATPFVKPVKAVVVEATVVDEYGDAATRLSAEVVSDPAAWLPLCERLERLIDQFSLGLSELLKSPFRADVEGCFDRGVVTSVSAGGKMISTCPEADALLLTVGRAVAALKSAKRRCEVVELQSGNPAPWDETAEELGKALKEVLGSEPEQF